MWIEFLGNSDLIAGGWILVVIMALSVVMWILILDRYWYLSHGMKSLSNSLVARWQHIHHQDSLYNKRLRSGLIATFHQELLGTVHTIQVITAILPLLGLLGTVSGMIKTFEVMTVFGSGNVRGMADGISQALLTTMAGLLTALSGMYFAANLSDRVEQETDNLIKRLNADSKQRQSVEVSKR